MRSDNVEYVSGRPGVPEDGVPVVVVSQRDKDARILLIEREDGEFALPRSPSCSYDDVRRKVATLLPEDMLDQLCVRDCVATVKLNTERLCPPVPAKGYWWVSVEQVRSGLPLVPTDYAAVHQALDSVGQSHLWHAAAQAPWPLQVAH